MLVFVERLKPVYAGKSRKMLKTNSRNTWMTRSWNRLVSKETVRVGGEVKQKSRWDVKHKRLISTESIRVKLPV